MLYPKEDKENKLLLYAVSKSLLGNVHAKWLVGILGNWAIYNTLSKQNKHFIENLLSFVYTNHKMLFTLIIKCCFQNTFSLTSYLQFKPLGMFD